MQKNSFLLNLKEFKEKPISKIIPKNMTQTLDFFSAFFIQTVFSTFSANHIKYFFHNSRHLAVEYAFK